MSFGDYAKKLFLVRKCAACGEILRLDSYYKVLCPECLLAFDVAKTETCPECQKAAFECTCQTKLLSKSGSLCLCKLYFYHTGREKAPQNKLIYNIKHRRSKRTSVFVATELWSVLCRELKLLMLKDYGDECVLVNMPRSKKGINKDGFDQAAELCSALSSASGIPYVPIIKRHFGGKEQKRLNATQRRRNIKSLIYPIKGAEEYIKGKYVILLDDVTTTGASMSACLNILRKMGTKGIICCCVAADLKNKSAR